MEWTKFDKHLPEKTCKQYYITIENKDGIREVLGIVYPIYYTNNLRNKLSIMLMEYGCDCVHVCDHRCITAHGYGSERCIKSEDIEAIPDAEGFYEEVENDDSRYVYIVTDKVIAWMEVNYPDPCEY